MRRVEFITYKGKNILFIDFSHLKTSEILPVVAEARKVIDQAPPNSLLTLSDMTEMRFDAATIEALKEYTAKNKPHVKAAAVIHMEGLLAVLKITVERSSNRTFQNFDSLEAAQEWLSQQE